MKKIVFFIIFLLLLLGCKESGNSSSINSPENDVVVEEEIIDDPEPPKPVYVDFGEEVVENAKKYLHVRETEGSNRSPEIDKFHDLQPGMPYGNPWCLMYVNYVWHETISPYGYELPYKTARVAYFLDWAMRHKLHYKVYYAKGIVYGAVKLEKGDMPIWISGVQNQPGDNFNGHAGFLIEQHDPTTIKTIEGNTGPGAEGSQREGDGVYIRERKINMNANFRIAAFVRYLLPQTEVKNETPR